MDIKKLIPIFAGAIIGGALYGLLFWRPIDLGRIIASAVGIVVGVGLFRYYYKK